jgi:hypothetical protein
MSFLPCCFSLLDMLERRVRGWMFGEKLLRAVSCITLPLLLLTLIRPMRTKLFLLALSCLFFLSATGSAQSAQPDFPPIIRPSPERQQMMNQEAQQRRIDIIKSGVRIHWDSRTSNMLTMAILTVSEDVRVALGVSDEQYRQILGAPTLAVRELENNLEARNKRDEMHAEMRALIDASETPDGLRHVGPLRQFFDAETWERVQRLQREIFLFQMVMTSDTYNGILTPEQERKMNEALLANMGHLPVVSSRVFLALDLTDFQKQQMKNFEQEFEAEFEKYLEDHVNCRIALEDVMLGIIREQEGATLLERTQVANKKLQEDAEFKRITEEFQSLQKMFAAQLMAEVYERNILTDEQWTRLQELIDSPPEHVGVVGRMLRMMNGEHEEPSGNENEGGNGWQPGPDSWRPGDALPVQIRERHEGRFPRGEE